MKRLTNLALTYVALPTVLLTAVLYAFATRHPGPYQRLFESQWDAILAGFAITGSGLLGLAFGVRLCFSVLGAYQPENVRNGLVAMVVGGTVCGVGVVLLWGLLAP
ncbi:hypothetical protein [Streptomyces sp. NPDC047981]|uniref:hypothetical protein n=1 Tax=Streptomyces sp. NPDC047981 TaxID=3154610 RepID=UPI0034156BA2